MTILNPIAKEIELNFESEIQYSICTLVTDIIEYNLMLDSFRNGGFDESNSEFLFINNSEKNNADAFKGLNFFLQKAKGKYIIICHQDILLYENSIVKLEDELRKLDTIDSNWAVLSNAGATGIKDIVYRVTESDNITKRRGYPIQKVVSVDEHFILVKKEANLSLSSNLNGFHLYGTDLCVLSNILGFNNYVIDFNLIHKSKGNVSKDFYLIKKMLILKYGESFKGRYIQTTCTYFYLSNSKLKSQLFESKFVMFFYNKYLSILKKIKKQRNIPKSEW